MISPLEFECLTGVTEVRLRPARHRPLYGKINFKFIKNNMLPNSTVRSSQEFNGDLISLWGAFVLSQNECLFYDGKLSCLEIIPSSQKTAVECRVTKNRTKLKKSWEQTSSRWRFLTIKDAFGKVSCTICGKTEEILICCGDLLWKPTGGLIRFISIHFPLSEI